MGNILLFKLDIFFIPISFRCSLITALYPNRSTKIAQLVLISGGSPTPLAPPADMNDISPYGWAHNLCYPFMYCGLKRYAIA